MSWETALEWAGPVGDLLGGVLGMSGQESANRSNERIAKDNRAFQERMSSTAYRRAAEDLDAAGLNRILALGSPSSTPGGATAVMQNKKAPLARGVAQSAHTALAIKKAGAEIKNVEATTRGTDANTELTELRTLIATHGEVIASITADIARTVKALTGNKSPDEIAKIIKEQISKASGAITDYLEKMGNTGKELSSAYDRTVDTIWTYVNDRLDIVEENTRRTNERDRQNTEHSDQKARINKLRPEQLKIFNRQSRKYIDMGYLPWKARNMALDDATRAN